MLEFINEKKTVILILFTLGLVVGTLIANSLDNDILSQISILNNVFFEQYQTMNINYKELFQVIAVNRIVPLLVMMFIGTTTISLFLMCGSLVYFGFVAGFILSSSVIKFGAMGLWLSIAYQFPHLLIYMAGVALLYYKLYCMAQERMESGIYQNNSFQYLMVCAIVVGIFLLGMIVETFINPLILKGFIGSFM